MSKKKLFLQVTLLTILLTTPTQQTCEKGCLKCNLATDECIFCDYTNNFALKNGACEEKLIENCTK